MLTADLARPRIYPQQGQVKIRTLSSSNPHWIDTASDLIELFWSHADRPLGSWQEALESYIGDRTDYLVIRGLAKVLSDSGAWQSPEVSVPPEELRHQLFSLGPVFGQSDFLHPVTRESYVHSAAQQHNLSVEQLEAHLFADRSVEQVLADTGPMWTPASLIGRYNLELARATLYWSDRMTVHLHDTYKDFWKYVKLFKLMFWATPLDGGGYEVVLDGPISPFVKSTTRYGRQMAAFLPALFLCTRWRMWASIRLPHLKQSLTFHLDHSAPLTSHFTGSGEFDSRLEADFADEFQQKFGDERGSWSLTREDELILLGDTVMIPDFTFTNRRDGRKAILEIMGFWHPDYLERKLRKVHAAKRNDLILLVYEGVNLTKERLAEVPSQVLYFRRKPVLKDVMALVERVAV